MADKNVETLVINNFHGSMTPYQDGDINSGMTFETPVFGYDPFVSPGNLTWAEEPEQIDPDGNVVTDMIVCMKPRVENGIVYVYAVGHTGRVYKIQVNDPTTYNPDYDNPVLLTTLTTESPTFTRGGSIDFFGSTEKIYIGHDKGVTSLNFDGTGEAFVGVLGSWTQDVPRPFTQFIGSLFIGNGENLAQIDNTSTVITYAKLSPSFPRNSQVRDLDVTPDGNYIQAIVNQLALADITSTAPNTTLTIPSDSFVFKWNGTDTGATSFVTYPNVSLTAGIMFGPYSYLLGYDFRGGGLYSPERKIITSSPDSTFGESPLPNAVISLSNMMAWITTLPYAEDGVTFNLQGLWTMYGTIAEDPLSEGIQPGTWAPLNPYATDPETEINRIPCQSLVSNYAQGGSLNGYTNGIFSRPKIYYSTLESSDGPTTAYRLYKWSPVATGLGNATNGAYYQTQSQQFEKKIQVKQVRVYGDPWVANNAFTIHLIGSDGNDLANGSKTFTAGSNLTVGNNYAWWTPQVENTPLLAIGIENNGTANFIITRIEIDYALGGQ